uniref:CUB domain-containing protein n=1 Tax=Megaselia scalaris TaxID=36166 RepID=T1GGT1_MEGSC
MIGPSVETQQCGQPMPDWECIYNSGYFDSGNEILAHPGISEEIGPGCRCGCIVHLAKRMIASSTESCPGKSFWLIQADGPNTRIRMKINYFRLPCEKQYLKIRDGDSVSSNLLSEKLPGIQNFSAPVTSSGHKILIELFSEKKISEDSVCSGGFLAHVELIEEPKEKVIYRSSFSRKVLTQKSRISKDFTLVHVVAVIFAGFIIIISALLGAQYILRYRKYHLTISQNDTDSSPLHTPRGSVGSLQMQPSPPSRALSTTTLLSEVIYLVKLRTKTNNVKHSILRESVDAEAAILTKETKFNDPSTKKKKTIHSNRNNRKLTLIYCPILILVFLNETNSN